MTDSLQEKADDLAWLLEKRLTLWPDRDWSGWWREIATCLPARLRRKTWDAVQLRRAASRREDNRGP